MITRQEITNQEIILVSREEASEIIDYFAQKNEGKTVEADKERLGMFLAKDNGTWVAIDNTDGNAWTEDFKSMEVAVMWLQGARLDTTSAHALDDLISNPKRTLEVMGALFRRVAVFEEDRLNEALEADGITRDEALGFYGYLEYEDSKT